MKSFNHRFSSLTASADGGGETVVGHVCSSRDVVSEQHICFINYSGKLQQGLKFGDLVNLGQNANIKTSQLLILWHFDDVKGIFYTALYISSMWKTIMSSTYNSIQRQMKLKLANYVFLINSPIIMPAKFPHYTVQWNHEPCLVQSPPYNSHIIGF